MKNFPDRYKEACEQIDVSENFSADTLDKISYETNTIKQSQKPFHKKLFAVVAAIMAVLMLTGTVFAAEHFRKVRLSENAGFSAKTNEYTENVDLTVEHNGLTVNLTEAVCENNKLYITFNYRMDDMSNVALISNFPGSILIDGKEIFCTVINTGSIANDGIYFVTCEYDLDTLQYVSGNDFKLFTLSPGEHDFVLDFEYMEIMHRDGCTTKIDGPWSFRFSLDTDSLKTETVIYSINKEIILQNGDRIILDKIICTPLSQRLCYNIIPADGNDFISYRVSAKATDSLGSQYEFSFHSGSLHYGESVNIMPDNFSYDSDIISLIITITDRNDNILFDSDEAIIAHENNS
ncbi:MAG: DUF4179 domain-containing protein [Oscillospiraceae bacterium]|nr:DUF4179 domain-containing protein [Oscillospiraceae bacterium]